MNYWLMKSEPDKFSIDDLKNCPDKKDFWDGIRNYQARNMMRDDMKNGDLVFFYHSSCKQPSVVGIMKIVGKYQVDESCFDAKSPYYDPKSDASNPRWGMVQVKFVRKFKQTITLEQLKSNKKLNGFPLIKRGNRLSILPVTSNQWETILSLEKV